MCHFAAIPGFPLRSPPPGTIIVQVGPVCTANIVIQIPDEKDFWILDMELLFSGLNKRAVLKGKLDYRVPSVVIPDDDISGGRRGFQVKDVSGNIPIKIVQRGLFMCRRSRTSAPAYGRGWRYPPERQRRRIWPPWNMPTRGRKTAPPFFEGCSAEPLSYSSLFS